MFNDKSDQFFLKLTHASLWVLALFTFVSFSISALHHILLLPAGIYFTLKAIKEKTFSYPKSALALWVFIFVALISILVNFSLSHEPLRNIFKLKYFIIPLIGYFALKEFHQKKGSIKNYRLLINTFLVSTSVATISGLIALATNFNPLRFKAACHATRACGAYGMYMTYGYGIALFMILLVGIFVYKKEFKNLVDQKIFWFAFIVNLSGLYFTDARGAWLGFIIAIPFYTYHFNKKRFAIIGVATAVIFSSLVFLSPKLYNTFFNRDDSNSQRLSFWKASIEAFKEKPVLGYGYKNFEPHSVDIKTRHKIEFAGIQGHAHSNYLEILASTGIIGLIVFLSFILFWFRANPFTQAFVMTFFISGLFQVTWGDGENLFLIIIVYFLSLVIKQKIPSN